MIHCHKKILWTAAILLTLTTGCTGAKYGVANTSDTATRIPKTTTPIMDYWMRDTWITFGPDGYYYMIGTTADPQRKFEGQVHCWDWNDGLYLFRSANLGDWDSMGRIWALDKDGSWQKEPKIYAPGEKYAKRSLNGDPLDNKFQAVWAPELHYIKSQKCWFIVACMNNSAKGKGSFILRSTTGRPEGPYVNIEGNENGPLFDNIDGSLFEDEDGTVYFVGHNHYIARMKSDMSGLAEPIRKLDEQAYSPEPYVEGAFICKHDGKYHLVQAIWSHRLPSGVDAYNPEKDDNKTRYSYDCIIASADNIYGPYSKRYNAITGGGHNNLFRDRDGQWWATIFFNPRGSQAKEYAQTCRPGIVPMKYCKSRFMIDSARAVKPYCDLSQHNR
ncbi:MAG: family 43 glycosylhydrolase [Muribaculaceae bacterium]|nr:family 43 glycosylhydrolase [Muribaculaceae bacterium]